MAELNQLLANEISIYHRAKSKFESDYDSISRPVSTSKTNSHK